MKFSYSRLSIFKRCRKKFEYRYVLKIETDVDSPVFEKGKFIHALLEHYPKLPEFEFKFKEVESKKMDYISLVSNKCKNDKKIKFLYTIPHQNEVEFNLDEKLENTADGDNSALYGIIDYVGRNGDTIIMVDWKTGFTQIYASFDQLKLYSIPIFNSFPDINTIKAFLFFIEQDVYVYEEISRTELSSIKEKLLNEINEINECEEYTRNVKEDCQFCEYYKLCQPFKVKLW